MNLESREWQQNVDSQNDFTHGTDTAGQALHKCPNLPVNPRALSRLPANKRALLSPQSPQPVSRRKSQNKRCFFNTTSVDWPSWDWRPLESRHSLPSGATCTASAHNLKATNRIWLTSFEFATLIYPTVIDFYKQCISTYLKTMELILNQMIQLWWLFLKPGDASIFDSWVLSLKCYAYPLLLG